MRSATGEQRRPGRQLPRDQVLSSPPGVTRQQRRPQWRQAVPGRRPHRRRYLSAIDKRRGSKNLSGKGGKFGVAVRPSSAHPALHSSGHTKPQTRPTQPAQSSLIPRRPPRTDNDNRSLPSGQAWPICSTHSYHITPSPRPATHTRSQRNSPSSLTSDTTPAVALSRHSRGSAAGPPLVVADAGLHLGMAAAPRRPCDHRNHAEPAELVHCARCPTVGYSHRPAVPITTRQVER